jgi:hypothetical protein
MANNDITPFQFKPGEVSKILEVPTPEQQATDDIAAARDDFDTVRNNLLELIDVGKDAIGNVADLADQSQAFKYYEVLNGLLKTAIEGNRELLNIHKTKKDIGGVAAPKVVKNQLIVTSAEMLALINGKEEEKNA